MTRRFADMSTPSPRRPLSRDLLLVAVPAGVLVLALILWMSTAKAACSSVRMQEIAQQCAYQMARNDVLAHCGNMGQRAENVAYGYDTEAATLSQWRRSRGHAANMRLPGCRGVASAVSGSGRKYWALEIDW